MLSALLLLASAAVVEPLSYRDALDRAVQHNLGLAGARADEDGASGALMAARGFMDPTLTANLGFNAFTREDSGQFGETLTNINSRTMSTGVSNFFPTGTTAALNYESTRSKYKYELRESGLVFESDQPLYSSKLNASLTQAVLRGHRMAANLQGVRGARRALDAAGLELERQRQQVVADTATAYWNVWYTQRLADIAAQAVEVALEEQRVVAAKVQGGELAAVEQSRVDALLIQARSDQLEAQNAAQTAMDALLLLLGQDPGDAFSLATAPADPIALSLDTDAVLATAETHNPALRQARLGAEHAELDTKDARHNRLPQLNATGSYALSGYETTQADSLAELASGDLPEWYLGADLSVPLGNRADRGNWLSAKANQRRADLDARALGQSIAQQVRAQVRNLEAARTKVDLAEANLRLAEQTLAAERALQEAGRAIQKDVLESIKNVDNARAGVEGARADYQTALIELERLKGTL